MNRQVKTILRQTIAQIAIWLGVCTYLHWAFGFSMVFLSVGIAFILPMHSVRLNAVNRPPVVPGTDDPESRRP